MSRPHSIEAGIAAQVATRLVQSADILDEGQVVFIDPQEVIYVEKAGERRRRDFILGRHCARMALNKLGIENIVIGRNASGAPLWPHNIVGSITHTEGYAAALVSKKKNYLAIGVDAERSGGIGDEMFGLLFNGSELDELQGLQESRRQITATVIFSAKESYYKAWQTLADRPLDFQDIHIQLKNEHEIEAASRLDSPIGAAPVSGLYTVHADLILTSIYLAP